MTKIEGMSVIIPTVRTESQILDNLFSVACALDIFNGDKELLIVADRKIQHRDFLKILAERYTFVKLFEAKIRKGSANARIEALRKTQYSVILFTDDDCIISDDWVRRMYKEVQIHGVVTGNLQPIHKKNFFSRLDAYIDQLRIQSVDKRGNIKYISFPNFGIQRQCLPKQPFCPNRLNTTEDIDLACRLRLGGIKIKFDKSISVQTEYPRTLIGLLERKVKHAKGIAFLRSTLDSEKCFELELGETPTVMLLRWTKLSLNAPFNLYGKLCLLLANTIYCIGLAYYDKKFRNLKYCPFVESEEI